MSPRSVPFAQPQRLRRALLAGLTALVAIGLVVPASPGFAAPTQTLSGTVTGTDTASALEGITVRLLVKTGAGYQYKAKTTTNERGQYSFALEAAGIYAVEFGIPFATKYRTQNWNDKPRLSAHTAITVGTNSVTGIDAVLANDPEYDTTRLSGADRFATAVTISQKKWTNSPTVFLANGMDFPDALSVAALAGGNGSPLLLTPPNELPAIVINELRRLSALTVVLAGGEAVISKAIADTLSRMGYTVVRLAGTDRYETSRVIAASAADSSRIFLATGRDFPDALSAAAAAGSDQAAVLLIDGMRPTLDQATLNFVRGVPRDFVFAVGGKGVISQGIGDQLKAIYGDSFLRISGQDRFETSVAVVGLAGQRGSHPVIATGYGFADALAGAALAGATFSPLYLTTPNCLPTSLGKWMAALPADMVYIAGGPGVASDNVLALRTCEPIW